MSAQIWHADIDISRDLAKQCIAEQFPALGNLENFHVLGEGWDNLVFLLNDRIVFRFPKRKIAVALLERENIILQHIKNISILQIPQPKYIGKLSNAYPYPFQGYDMMPGLSGCHTGLTKEERIASAQTLATFLKSLHEIETNNIDGICPDPVFDRTDTRRLIHSATERVEQINDENIARIDFKVFEHELDLARELTLPDKKCLVHNDLYSRHLMFNRGKLTGLIDWGDSGISSPATDLCILHSFYPKEAHSLFIDVYGEIDEITWQYARFFGLYSSITSFLYAHHVKDEKLFKESRSGIARINPALLTV